MSFIVESNKEFKLVPQGTHLARCYRIIDLGTQQTEWQGQEKFLRKIMVAWEIHGEDDTGQPIKTDEGEPMAIFKNYTLSWSENSNLRKDLQAWRGAPWTDQEAIRFDLKNILGQWCMISVVHRPGANGKTYANVWGLTPVPGVIKRQGMPDPYNDVQIFRLADPDWGLFDTFGKGLKAKIESSPEYQAISKKKDPPKNDSGFDYMDEDIPF